METRVKSPKSPGLESNNLDVLASQALVTVMMSGALSPKSASVTKAGPVLSPTTQATDASSSGGTTSHDLESKQAAQTSDQGLVIPTTKYLFGEKATDVSGITLGISPEEFVKEKEEWLKEIDKPEWQSLLSNCEALERQIEPAEKSEEGLKQRARLKLAEMAFRAAKHLIEEYPLVLETVPQGDENNLPTSHTFFRYSNPLGNVIKEYYFKVPKLLGLALSLKPTNAKKSQKLNDFWIQHAHPVLAHTHTKLGDRFIAPICIDSDKTLTAEASAQLEACAKVNIEKGVASFEFLIPKYDHITYAYSKLRDEGIKAWEKWVERNREWVIKLDNKLRAEWEATHPEQPYVSKIKFVTPKEWMHHDRYREIKQKLEEDLKNPGLKQLLMNDIRGHVKFRLEQLKPITEKEITEAKDHLSASQPVEVPMAKHHKHTQHKSLTPPGSLDNRKPKLTNGHGKSKTPPGSGDESSNKSNGYHRSHSRDTNHLAVTTGRKSRSDSDRSSRNDSPHSRSGSSSEDESKDNKKAKKKEVKATTMGIISALQAASAGMTAGMATAMFASGKKLDLDNEQMEQIVDMNIKLAHRVSRFPIEPLSPTSDDEASTSSNQSEASSDESTTAPVASDMNSQASMSSSVVGSRTSTSMSLSRSSNNS